MKTIRASAFAFGLVIAATGAFAAGGGGGGGGSSGGGSAAPQSGTNIAPTQMHCKTGEVVKTIRKKGMKAKKMCVKATAGIIPDDELYAQGWLLAKTGEYDWALSAFNAMTDKQKPEVLTMIGYSNRKAGRLEVAVSYYDQALALQPDFVRAREYLGEGYVAAGRLDLAKVQLNEIALRAGTSSDEYMDLSKVIAGTSTEL